MNNKLQSIEEEKAKRIEKTKCDVNDAVNISSLISPRTILTVAFVKAVAFVYPNIPSSVVTLVPTTNSKFGDYQCNAAMPIYQQLKSSGSIK